MSDITISEIKGVFETIKKVASAHIATASFEWGEQFDFPSKSLYPMFFLELPMSIVEGKNSETYSLAFVVADKTVDITETLDLLAKTKQIASEIKHRLSNHFLSVSDMNILTFTDQGDDVTCGCRCEISVTVRRGVMKCDNVFRD